MWCTRTEEQPFFYSFFVNITAVVQNKMSIDNKRKVLRFMSVTSSKQQTVLSGICSVGLKTPQDTALAIRSVIALHVEEYGGSSSIIKCTIAASIDNKMSNVSKLLSTLC